MYCVNCGVKLADTEAVCPLCKTKVYHPDITRGEGEKLYPENKYPKPKHNLLPQVILTISFILPAIIVFLCDMQFSGGVTWSGYVIGALLCGYVTFILPGWFRNPHPAIFVPCTFVMIGAFLLYISLVTKGGWFLSFAFPLVGGVGLIVTTVAILLYYLKRGVFFILGGASIALGGFMMLVEFLLNYTFGITRLIWWSLYPLASLAVIGGFLIFLGAYRPVREAMQRRFFI